MSACLHTALIGSLSAHLGLSTSRLETLSVRVIGLIHGRTVNLTHIASHCRGPACSASKSRRLQRFFQHVRLDQAVVAALVVRRLGLSRPKCLALDRTNWKLGRRDVNILMLAIFTRRFRGPVFWSVLDHSGTSSLEQPIALMRRSLALFEPRSITMLLADRAFVGAAWIKFLADQVPGRPSSWPTKFLADNDSPFAIRVRQDLHMALHMALSDGSRWSIETLLRTRRARQILPTRDLFLPEGAVPVRLAARRLAGGEWRIVMSNRSEPRRALQAYRTRWGVEGLFGDAKTRGLNLEDTHLTDPDKIDPLTALVALAITWTYKAATFTRGMKAIPRKSHGRRQKSWCRTGFDALRSAILNAPPIAAALWTDACPKRLTGVGVVYRRQANASPAQVLGVPQVFDTEPRGTFVKPAESRG